MNRIKSDIVFSLKWYCGFCGKDNPALSSTTDGWVVCPHCGSKYDVYDFELPRNLMQIIMQLEAFGIPYIGGKIR